MKKNIVRIVALLLVAMLALTLLPLGAFAIEAGYLETNVYEKNKPSVGDPYYSIDSGYYEEGTKIKVKDFDQLYTDANGDLYDFRGFATTEKFQKKADKIWNDTTLTDKEKQAAIQELAEDIDLNFVKKDIKVDAFPDKGTEEEKQNWYNKWFWVIAGYTPHQHKLSRLYSDGTTHWRECLVCNENFIYQNWCQDGDEDGICNVCGGDVPYHDVTVVEAEGGKITVNRDTASHRMKITADVEVADGYKLEKLHFIKVRPDGSRQEVTRKKLNGQFWTPMPTYDLEVSAEFVKD